jgi:hypothetical protein
MSTKFAVSVRVGAGILLVSLMSFLSTAKWLKEIVNFDPRAVGTNKITQYLKRFDSLKKVLPDRGVIGYICDASVPSDSGKVQDIRRYYLTQYALSPLIILDTPHCKQVIGNFHEAEIDSQIYRQWNVEVLAKFDGVVWLLNKNVK